MKAGGSDESATIAGAGAGGTMLGGMNAGASGFTGSSRAAVEVTYVVELALEFVEIRLPHHFIDMSLELSRHAARLLDHAADRAYRGGHVLRPDRDQRDGGDQGNLGPGEIEHEGLGSPRVGLWRERLASRNTAPGKRAR